MSRNVSRPARRHRLVHVALVASLLGAPSSSPLAAEPACRFPGPWKQIVSVRNRISAHLSPLQIAADPTVIRDGGIYRMWFTNADSLNRTGIAYAESPDGLTWDVWKKSSGPDPIMDLVLTAPASGWDAPGIESANVIRMPTGRYRMYYSGNRVPQGSVTYAIGMAESADGIRWTRASKPVLEPMFDWEKPLCGKPNDPNSCSLGGVLEPSVLYDPASKLYKLWYAGLGEKSDSYRTFRIGYATSPDGTTWTRNRDPVLALGPKNGWDELWTSHVNVVADSKAGYHMFYFGSRVSDYKDGIEMQRGAIGHAYSSDGINWERNPSNPVLSPRAGQIDAWTLGGPSVVAEEGKFRMWYFGNPTSGLKSEIVTAEATCGP